MNVPFLDLKAQYAPIRSEVDAAIARTIDNTAFILGPGVTEFEEDFARYTGTEHCVGLNSGTSALHLALLAAGVGPGCEVVTTPHTWISTSWAISYTGATPVYADVDETGNIDPHAAEKVITDRTKAILPVDLYGNPARHTEFEALAESAGVALIDDAAQAHGAKLDGRSIGTFGAATCFSFYPGKNLGAAGEGGAVVTSDGDFAEKVRQLRDHAQQGRHVHTSIGYNYRMEGLQGAVLAVKLPHLDAWNSGRRAAADRYRALLAEIDGVTLPSTTENAQSSWHLYVIRTADRDGVATQLGELGVSTGIHYPTPVHLQPAYAHLGYERGAFPNAEAFAANCLSLPMYGEITAEQQQHVATSLRSIMEGRA